MTRDQLHRYYRGTVLDVGDSVASIHHYAGRCARCGQWLEADIVAHGNLVMPFCPGTIVRRARTTVHVFDGPDFSPYRYRKATAAERREALAAKAPNRSVAP